MISADAHLLSPLTDDNHLIALRTHPYISLLSTKTQNYELVRESVELPQTIKTKFNNNDK